jgi:protein-disulfide isomerase
VNLGVKGTPTFFLNGEKIEGPAPLTYWEQRLNKMLKEVK